MWLQRDHPSRRIAGFFLISINDEGVVGFYKTNFELYHDHGLSLDEIHNMYPFEREIYIMLTNQHIEKKNQETAKANQR